MVEYYTCVSHPRCVTVYLVLSYETSKRLHRIKHYLILYRSQRLKTKVSIVKNLTPSKINSLLN